MSYMPRIDAAPSVAWATLVDELDRWDAAGLVVPLWWRDDDAVSPSARLDMLFRLADGTPFGLAVIPGLVRSELAAVLPDNVTVLQHGWLHANRATSGKSSEYPEDRDASRSAAEIAAGRARLRSLFGDAAAPVFVPPWNRMAACLQPLLPQSNVTAISAMVSHEASRVSAAIARLDVHVDLTAWRGDRGFVGEAAALGDLVRQLERSRIAAATGMLPIGILTHHLVMDAATAAFIEQLLTVTKAHTAARWVSPAEYLS